MPPRIAALVQEREGLLGVMPSYLPSAGLAYLPPCPDLPRLGAGRIHGALVAWAQDDAGRIVGGQRILILPVEANEVFIRATPEEAAALRAQGFDFYDWGPGEARLVTSWDSDLRAVDTLARAIAAL